MAETSTVGTGSSVYFNYSATQNACEQLNAIINDLKDRYDQITNLINQRDSVWAGEAADRFWEALLANNSDYSLEIMNNITSEEMPKAITAVLNLIDENKTIDGQIMSGTITDANANDNIQSNAANVDANGVNTQLNDSVHTEGSIHSNDADVNASGVNEQLNSEVQANDNVKSNDASIDANGVNTQVINDANANDNIKSNDATVDATGVNTQTINDVHTNDDVQSNEATVNASGINTQTINNVGITNALGGNSSVNTTTETNSAFDSILNNFKNS